MARISYARVSSLDQDLEGQLARLQREGCTIVRSEKVSGVSRDGRPELATVLQFLRVGDELVVTRAAGKSVGAIAASLGCSRMQIYRVLQAEAHGRRGGSVARAGGGIG